MKTVFEDVVASAFVEQERGTPVEQALQHAADAHRHPEHERRLAARRAELGEVDSTALAVRARGYGLRVAPRDALIEGLARHEVNNEITAELFEAELEREGNS